MTNNLAEYKADNFNLIVDELGRIIVRLLPKKIVVMQDAHAFINFIESQLPKLNLALPRPVCVDVRYCLSISSEASQYIAARVSYYSCVSVINEHLEGNRAANIAFSIKELEFPIQVFNCEKKAIEFITLNHNKNYPKNKLQKS